MSRPPLPGFAIALALVAIVIVVATLSPLVRQIAAALLKGLAA